VAAGRCWRPQPHESVRPVGLWASIVIRGWSKPRKLVLPTYPGSTGLWAINHVGSDPYAGRKLLDRFTRAELGDVRLDAQTPFVPFVDARLE